MFLIKRKTQAIYLTVDCPQFREGLHENVTLVRIGSSLPKPLPASFCFAWFLKKKKKKKKQFSEFSISTLLVFVLFFYFFTATQKNISFLLFKVKSIKHVLAHQVPLNLLLTLYATHVLKDTVLSIFPNFMSIFTYHGLPKQALGHSFFDACFVCLLSACRASLSI